VRILWDSGNIGFGGCGINEWDRNVIDALRKQNYDVTLIVDAAVIDVKVEIKFCVIIEFCVVCV
jgi:hypothetical protein